MAGALCVPAGRLTTLGQMVLFFEILLVAVSILIGWFGLYVFYRLFTES